MSMDIPKDAIVRWIEHDGEDDIYREETVEWCIEQQRKTNEAYKKLSNNAVLYDFMIVSHAWFKSPHNVIWAMALGEDK